MIIVTRQENTRLCNITFIIKHILTKNVADFEHWAGYRPGIGKFTPDDIDPTLCTHIMYGFATLDTNTLLLKAYDTWVDIDQSKFLNECRKVEIHFVLNVR